MNLYKTLWALKNVAEFAYRASLKKGSGLLSHKVDPRDIPFIGVTDPERTETSIDMGYRYAQKPFNVCVFASRALGVSHQDGIRWSVRWDVKVARKLGMLKGNGWSYLRAENDITYKTGRIPYVLMPDEIGSMSFEEYSKWTKEDDKLLEIAKQYTRGYKQITSYENALAALDNQHVLFGALTWQGNMNKPQPSEYLITDGGGTLGGHAVLYNGYRYSGKDLENIQTFGALWGKNGKAWLRNMWKRKVSDVYVEDHLSPELLSTVVSKYYRGKIVRDISDPACFYITDEGKKRGIPSIEEYFDLGGKHETVAKRIIDLIPNA